jgi:hypothetical protein
MAGTINEILEDASKDIKSIMAHKDNKYLRNFMESAFIPEKKMILPEGLPPYKANNMHEQQLRGTFWQIAKKMETFTRSDVKSIKREMAFIQALESLPEVEVAVFVAAKDQALHKKFKGVTLKALKEVGYFPS